MTRSEIRPAHERAQHGASRFVKASTHRSREDRRHLNAVEDVPEASFRSVEEWCAHYLPYGLPEMEEVLQL